MELLEHDIVIIGSGIAGMTAALHASLLYPKRLSIAIISKTHAMRSHSVAAEGGISGVVYPENGIDSFYLHAYDTIKGSDYLADQDAVELLVKEAPSAIKLLDHIGVPWNRDSNGDIVQRPFGGMSVPRTAFAADKTGFFIMRALYDELLRHGNVQIFHEHFVTKMVIGRDGPAGTIAMDISTGKFKAFSAKCIIIATGGFSRIYGFTTNSYSNTGDGTALAYRAGLPLKDVEFVQFHPTGLVPSGILITEAVRGEGGYLINSKGRRFMEDYAKSKMELAPRDIVSRAIMSEIMKGNGIAKEKYGMEHVLLDLRHLDPEVIHKKLPMVREITTKMLDLDPSKEPIPIRPVAHFTMGGIHTNMHGQVMKSAKGEASRGIWAAGECACVSVHGSNRLGSNSLSQCSVWGKIAGIEAAKHAMKAERSEASARLLASETAKEIESIEKLILRKKGEDPYEIRDEMQSIMDTYLYVYRDAKGMKKALDKLHRLMKRYKNVAVRDKSRVYNTNLRDVLELGNMLELSILVGECAIRRKESRGSHMSVEHPRRDDGSWLKHTIIQKTRTGFNVSYLPVRITKWKPEERKY